MSATVEHETIEGEERTELKRAIGPKLLLLFIVGDILGGGIYALVGEVGGRIGGAIWVAFATALVLAACGQLHFKKLPAAS